MAGPTPFLTLSLLVAAVAGAVAAGGRVQLQPTTIAAYDAYAARVRAAFLERARADGAAPGNDACVARAGRVPDGRIVKIDGGLVHQWRGAIRIPEARLARALAVSRDYDAYPGIHPAVIAARVIGRDGPRLDVVTRLRGGAAGVTAVLQLHTVVEYHVGPASAFAIGETRDIREVVHPGLPDEYLLPQGEDSGYLWRAHTFTRFVAHDGGVDVELETLGLSRRFPRLLGWILEPIARGLGRRSVEATLREFDLAVRGDAAVASDPTP